jgi:hypothetical protein
MSFRKTGFPIESILAQHQALDAMNSLVNSGCERPQLLALLDLINQGFPGFDTPQGMTGLSKKQLGLTIKRLLGVANEMAAINKHAFGLTLLPPSSFGYLRHLPDAVRSYAAILCAPMSFAGRVRRPTLHVYKFYITRHVIDSTKKPHDEEVAALIGAVLASKKGLSEKNPGRARTYDAVAHKQWRHLHYLRLAADLESKK